MTNQAPMRLRIELPANRDYTGTISLLAGDGNYIAGPFAVCARSGDRLADEHGNPSRTTTLPYGDTPLGIYRVVAFAPTGTGTKYGRDLFGAHGAFILHAVSGDAALAEANGRFEILIHGGPLSPDGRLRATSGGMRIADNDLCVLAGFISQCRGLICECFQVATLPESVQVDGEFNCEEPGGSSPKANWITPRARRVLTPELIAQGEYAPSSDPGAPVGQAPSSDPTLPTSPAPELVQPSQGGNQVTSGPTSGPSGDKSVDSFTGETPGDGHSVDTLSGAKSLDSFTGRPPSNAYSQNPSPDPYTTSITEQAPYQGVLASSRPDRFYVLDLSDKFPAVMLERSVGPSDAADSKTVQPQDEKSSGDAGGNYTPTPGVSGQVSSIIPPIDAKTVQPQDEKSSGDAGGNYTPAPGVSGQVSSTIPPIDAKTVQPQDEKSSGDAEGNYIPAPGMSVLTGAAGISQGAPSGQVPSIVPGAGGGGIFGGSPNDNIVYTRDPVMALAINQLTDNRMTQAWDVITQTQLPSGAPGGTFVTQYDPLLSAHVPNLVIVGGYDVSRAFRNYFISPERATIDEKGNISYEPAKIVDLGISYEGPTAFGLAKMGMDAISIFSLGSSIVEEAAISEITGAKEAQVIAQEAQSAMPPVEPAMPQLQSPVRPVLNLFGEGEVPGAISVNDLSNLKLGVGRPLSEIKAGGPLIQADIIEQGLPVRSASVSEVVGNRMPFMEGKYATDVASESFRVLESGGAVRLSASSGGGWVWRGYLEAAGFRNVHIELGYAVGVKP